MSASMFWEKSLPLPVQRPAMDWVKVSVADSGKGIPPQERDKIFKPFFTTKEQGTGLGLSLTKRLVQLHGGKIWAESEGEGKGSRFKFLIPLRSLEKPKEIQN
jgi:signal transduction histidine kinase